MTTTWTEEDVDDANWISELQRAKGRPIPLPPPSQPVARADGVAEMAYSPGQKRDNVGRFGSGGGGGAAPSSGMAPGVAGESVAGTDSRRTLQDATDKLILDTEGRLAQSGMRWDRPDAIARTSQVLKDQAMRAVGADLDAQFDRNRLAAATSAMRDTGTPHGDTPGEQMADAMLSAWQQGAYSLEKPSTVAMQIAVSQEFKTGVGKHIQKDFDDAAVKVDDWPATLRYDTEVMRVGVRSMYDHTQKRLDDLGVGDTVTLHRGVGRSDIRGDVEADFNAASSWSVDKATADLFARGGAEKHGSHGAWDDSATNLTGTRLTMTVDRRRIFAAPGTGVGCFEEGEAVVLRANGDRARGEDPE